MRFGYVLTVIVLALFLFGCVEEEPVAETPEPVNETVEEAVEEVKTCDKEWTCINNTHRAFQNEDCTLTEETFCIEGCSQGDCFTCEEKYHCKDDNTRAYQKEDCTWDFESTCEWGCEDGECKPEPVEEIPTVSKGTSNQVLKINEEIIVTDGDDKYLVKLIMMEPSQVVVEINSTQSDWLTENGTFSYKSIDVRVNDIFFQAYEGGLKEIIYSVE